MLFRVAFSCSLTIEEADARAIECVRGHKSTPGDDTMAWAMWIRDRKFQWIAIFSARHAATQVGAVRWRPWFCDKFQALEGGLTVRCRRGRVRGDPHGDSPS